MTITAPTATRAAPPGPVRSGAILTVLLVAQFMAILDVSVTNVAAPTIRADLHTSGAVLQLVVAGYTISYAVLLVTGARLGDRWGHGRAFRAGLAVFTIASLACGLAPNATALVLFRFVQGVGAAAMMPQVMSLIQRTFTGAARARALSIYSAVIASGAVVGQVLGGVLVSADVLGTGWRPVFLVNVPVGVVLMVMARRNLPHSRGDSGRGMDPAGVVTLSAAVLALVLPLVMGHEEGWPAWCWVSVAASVALFAIFILVERRVARVNAAPLVPGRVLRAPAFAVGTVVALLVMIEYGGFLFATALHLQSGLGFGPARAGLTFAPMAVGFAVTGLTWRRLPERWHAAIVPVGLIGAAAAFALLATVLQNGASVGAVALTVLAVLGLAMGLAFSPLLTVSLGGVAVADAADATGVVITAIQLGQVIGVATLGTAYLTLVDAPGSAASGSALGTAMIALAVTALVSALVSVRLLRPRAAG
jgi:EmrB/QacA subfamily drug resistance transporter